jgi:hypothetical protein
MAALRAIFSIEHLEPADRESSLLIFCLHCDDQVVQKSA